MKKLFLIITVALCSTRSYSQLMQSNSIHSSTQSSTLDTLQHLKKVSSNTDKVMRAQQLENTYKLIILKPDSLGQAYQALMASQVRLKTLEQQNKDVKLSKEIDSLKKLNEQMLAKLKIANDDNTALRSAQYSLYDQRNELIVNSAKQYIDALDLDLKLYKDQIDKNIKNGTGNFDTLLLASNHQDRRLIDTMRLRMQANSAIMKYKLELLVPERAGVDKYYAELKQYKSDLEKYTSIKDQIYTKAESTRKSLDSARSAFEKKKKIFESEYNTYIDNTNRDIDKLNNMAKAGKKLNDDEATDEQNLSALGGINNIFGQQGALIPNISLVGQKKFKSDASSSFYGDVKLFIGGNDNDKKKTGVNRLFIPDASTYGFMTNFTFGFISSYQKPAYSHDMGHYEHKLAVNLGVYYLGKKLQPDTLTDFSTSLFHLKLGLQYILIRNVLSVYVNTNQLLVTTNIDTFQKYYADANRVRSFTSFGFESYLELNKKSDFHLLVNMGFVKVNNDVNTWLKTGDSVIPNVKLSLVKTFNW